MNSFSRLRHLPAITIYLFATCLILADNIYAQVQNPPSALDGATAAAEKPFKPTAEQTKVLGEIRGALANRDLRTAETKLKEAAAIKGPQAYADQVERMDHFHSYLKEFWQAVAEGMNTFSGGSEFTIGETRTAVVEGRMGYLVLRVDGQNRRYTPQNVPGRLALELAFRSMKKEDPNNKVFFASFLAMDAKGNRDQAKEMLRQAAQGGVDVKFLMQELDPNTQGGNIASYVKIPKMVPAVRALLSPKKWNLYIPNPNKTNGWIRKDADSVASQNDEGRLAVTRKPTEKSPARVLGRSKVSGNFGCRVIVQDVPKGTKFGLFSHDAKDSSRTVALPEGTVKVELARIGSKLICRVNEKETQLDATGSTNPRLSGYLGIEIPAQCSTVIAWFELKK